ncbi:uncharacterized protein LOC121382206 [Gigantopelta aegis]|uniref:uncharacterized protein LOC121382206 n=1 Tax=Gigantopelta aegis TaxID=1735272 RepID=UPI001B888B2D|nr:uncharacterized protein LOC121382206 [Gigantopelta aegis]
MQFFIITTVETFCLLSALGRGTAELSSIPTEVPNEPTWEPDITTALLEPTGFGCEDGPILIDGPTRPTWEPELLEPTGFEGEGGPILIDGPTGPTWEPENITALLEPTGFEGEGGPILIDGPTGPTLEPAPTETCVCERAYGMEDVGDATKLCTAAIRAKICLERIKLTSDMACDGSTSTAIYLNDNITPVVIETCCSGTAILPTTLVITGCVIIFFEMFHR